MRALALFCLAWTALYPLWRPTALPTLNGPVSALAVDGDRLLIGQGSVLIDAAITPDALTIAHAVDVRHGAIRAILAIQGAALVLSEDGISVLDASDTPASYIAGGGQRLIAQGNRLYVAALDAGITIYTFANPLDGSSYKKIGHIDTAAEDIAIADNSPKGALWLWAASGGDGLRLFDVTDPAHPAVLFEATAYIPAHLVRAQGTRLYLGYANHFAVLDTANIATPQPLLDVGLGADTAFAGDLALDPKAALIGRVDVAGADVTLLDLSNPQAMREAARTGDAGSGDRLALHGNDLFVGSERTGLRRLTRDGLTLTVRDTWPASESAPCTDTLPLNPQPANLSLIAPSDSVTLSWSAMCLAPRYAIKVNGVQVAITTTPTYTFTPHTDLVRWQVIALPGTDQAVSGASWSFEIAHDGLIVLPTPLHPDAVLYHPPPIRIDWQSPGTVLAATCGALLIGLAIIVAGALAISAWFGRRQV